MRTKDLTCHCPICRAPMPLEYSQSYTGWERLSYLPEKCPKGHALPGGLRGELHELFDDRAAQCVGDPDERDICGHAESRR